MAGWGGSSDGGFGSDVWKGDVDVFGGGGKTSRQRRKLRFLVNGGGNSDGWLCDEGLHFQGANYSLGEATLFLTI